MDDDDEPWQLARPLRPPPEVTRALFLAWRAARTGDGNPEPMTNPVWTWLARHPDVTAYQAARHFTGEGSFGQAPGWTNHRFGQSTTVLPDGRSLAIAGEHEDYYDPDFYIYNDVIVTAPDGSVEIYGYRRDAFPATDFHTATLVGDHLYLIGSLGYTPHRGVRAQVLRLDVGTLAVAALAPGGDSPGWISRHAAILSDDATTITVSGGRCDAETSGGRVDRDAVDDHALDLRTLTWTRTTDRRWSQYRFERADGGAGTLWEISQLADYVARNDEWSRGRAAWYRERLTHEPDFDAWRRRYQPPIAFEPLPRGDGDDAWRTHRIVVEGVTVRYVDGSREVEMIVEGPLPAATIELLIEDLSAKLARADQGAYAARRLDG